MTITYILEGKLYVNLTNRCPNHCDFCIRNNGSSVGDAENLWLDEEPTREQIWEDFQKRNLSDFSEVVFCGYGEPTHRLEDMLWMCSKIREISNIDIRVNTNGLSDLINGRPTAKDFDGLVDIISISLNASSAEKYDEICHSDFGISAFDAVLRFTKNISMYVPRVYLSVVDRNTDPKELKNCEKICNEVGATFRVREYIG